MSASRPRRILAAWGYESSSSGDRVEVDVWTVNEPDDREGEGEAIRRAREAFDDRVERVIAAYGNVARVAYAGAAGEGYRYIDTDEPASQQAFAGAKRAAGGDNEDDGTFSDGYEPPPGEPAIEAAIAEGNDEVLPAVERADRGGMAAKLSRDPSRDEEGEPVETRPFDGFANVVRYFTGGRIVRYHVRNGSLKSGTHPRGEP